jgi:PAS domain S-box-containing protein
LRQTAIPASPADDSEITRDQLERHVAERTRQLREVNERLMREIAERRGAEQALRRSEAAYRRLYTNAPAPQHSLDSEGRILEVSDFWLELLGFDRHEVLGRSIAEFLSPESVERFHAGRAEFLACGEGRDEPFEFVKRSGEIVEALVSRRAERDASGHVVGTTAVLNDVTERRRVERERDRLFDISIDFIAIAGFDGRFHDINRALAGALGRPREALIGTRYLDFVHPEDRARAIAEIARLQRGEPRVRFEIRYRSRDGSWRWTSWRITAVHEEGLLYGIGRDTTERRETEEALRQAQKMEAVGQLTGGIAHDFNNLLTVILGNIELLRPRLESQPRIARMIASMQHAASRGERLTSQLLAFSRRQKLRPETLDVNALIRGFAPLLHRAVGEAVAVEAQLAAQPLLSTIDSAQLEAALLNLAVNARDAMPGGGVLAILTEELAPDDALALPEIKPGPYVHIAVRDTGSGMSEEVIERVFEPFFTTKEVGKGSGLGLSQVYGFVKQSGGHVAVESAPGEGTTIHLYLPPARAEDPVIAGGGARRAGPASGTGSILVVEDDTDVLCIAVDMLSDLGYDVLTAAQPIEALDMLRTDVPVDLLFSDVVMPQMSGQLLAREARALRPGLKILLTSGYSRRKLAAENVLDEGLPVIGKPYRQAELAAQVRTLIGGGATAG